ncbi:MAG: hypothetical protein COV08_00315 [Candidatus Vogelbacteria bacterium CG10_big_fil_rev_8_21_14_0_10_49_38]|uniref:YdbS-like PH domain-containing protein n=1 Tax=Candidatus Vogelbacteria bacterium CG10_big_fil_rev_8_21_14_0_10_49_38 TaxID=1975043 RepID=A0A2H0RKQ4_9BACT|nr:MAG: hypothetical protein BK006_00310 [bacterium CG10_49_38]PIR46365.1 MAG: hypothetical protein COV08_00315 [Candidatus Vogelbacteria bacterium CG10_big_fil_rev_8_21_14_0_10_49_38]
MKQLDPKAVWLFFINILVGWIFLIFFFGFWVMTFFVSIFGGKMIGYSFLIFLGIILPLFAILCFVWSKLIYRFYRYELVEDGFRKEHGVIWKKYVTIPYDRIQNVDIYRGVWARILGLSDLNIQTAGASAVIGHGGMGMGAEGRLPGLSHVVAEELRDELIRRAKVSKSQGL